MPDIEPTGHRWVGESIHRWAIFGSGDGRHVAEVDVTDQYAPVAEVERLRELYENAVGNRQRFGWTIDHLLECEEALRTAEAEVERLCETLHVVADRIEADVEAIRTLVGEDT